MESRTAIVPIRSAKSEPTYLDTIQSAGTKMTVEIAGPVLVVFTAKILYLP